jgi:1-phosphatidylinositol-4-phosphate 5-kinase
MLCNCSSKRKPDNQNDKKAYRDLKSQTKFSDEEIQVLREKFLMISKNKEFIDKKAFDELNVNNSSKNLSNDLNARIFNCLKNEEKIRFDDYVFFMNNLLHGGLQQKSLLLFKMIDVDQTGAFGIAEFNNFVKELIEFSQYNSFIRSSIKIEDLSAKIYRKFEPEMKSVTLERFQEVFMTNRKVFDILTYLKNELMIDIKGKNKTEEAGKYRLKTQLMFVENMLKKLQSDLKNLDDQKRQSVDPYHKKFKISEVEFATSRPSPTIEKENILQLDRKPNSVNPEMISPFELNPTKITNANHENVFIKALAKQNIKLMTSEFKNDKNEVFIEYRMTNTKSPRKSKKKTIDFTRDSDFNLNNERTPNFFSTENKEASVDPNTGFAGYAVKHILTSAPHKIKRFNSILLREKISQIPVNFTKLKDLPTITEIEENELRKNFYYKSSILNQNGGTQDFNLRSKKIDIKYLTKTVTSVLDYIGEIKAQLGNHFEEDSSNDSIESIMLQSRIGIHKDNVPKLVFNDIKSTVFFLHKNWNLVLHMMIGIQLSVVSLAKYQRPLNSYDFNYRGIFDLTPIQGMKTFSLQMNEKSFSKCYFHDYAPYVFREIRRLYGIKDENYLESIGSDHLIKNLINGDLAGFSENISSGKSGSFFYYSRDGKFVLKTIHKSEKSFFLSILENYNKHLQNHPESLIVKIFGIHKIIFTKLRVAHKTRKSIRFCIMNNTFDTNFKIDQRYDIKGSLYKREVITNNPQIALKDKNLLNNNRILDIEPASRVKLMGVIDSDVSFFKENNIIDYSLLLGIHKVNAEDEPLIKYEMRNRNRFTITSKDGTECYYLSIIDFFTQYDLKKKTEFFFKSHFLSQDVSAIPPKPYGERFYNFIQNNLLPDEPVT